MRGRDNSTKFLKVEWRLSHVVKDTDGRLGLVCEHGHLLGTQEADGPFTLCFGNLNVVVPWTRAPVTLKLNARIRMTKERIDKDGD